MSFHTRYTVARLDIAEISNFLPGKHNEYKKTRDCGFFAEVSKTLDHLSC